MGCFVYTIFGTSKDVTLGPTAIMSLLVASKATSVSQSDSINVRNAVALTLLSGLTQFLMGISNLGEFEVLQFVSCCLQHVVCMISFSAWWVMLLSLSAKQWVIKLISKNFICIRIACVCVCIHQ